MTASKQNKSETIDYLIQFFRIFNRILNKVSTIIWIVVLLLAAYAMFDSYVVYNQAGTTDILKYKPNMESDSEEPAGIITGSVAWITIDDTNIDYPIMQGKDNNEYLNKDPFGKFSLGGSIFLDYRNSSDFTDPYNLIYGHHMEHGAMFGALDDFKDQEFFEAHEKGTIVIDKKVYPINVLAVVNCVVTDTAVFNPKNNTQYMNFINKNALFKRDIEIDENDTIVALTTCAASPSEARLAVFCVLER